MSLLYLINGRQFFALREQQRLSAAKLRLQDSFHQTQYIWPRTTENDNRLQLSTFIFIHFGRFLLINISTVIQTFGGSSTYVPPPYGQTYKAEVYVYSPRSLNGMNIA